MSSICSSSPAPLEPRHRHAHVIALTMRPPGRALTIEGSTVLGAHQCRMQPRRGHGGRTERAEAHLADFLGALSIRCPLPSCPSLGRGGHNSAVRSVSFRGARGPLAGNRYHAGQAASRRRIASRRSASVPGRHGRPAATLNTAGRERPSVLAAAAGPRRRRQSRTMSTISGGTSRVRGSRCSGLMIYGAAPMTKRNPKRSDGQAFQDVGGASWISARLP
jgi:hypothetical protein